MKGEVESLKLKATLLKNKMAENQGSSVLKASVDRVSVNTISRYGD